MRRIVDGACASLLLIALSPLMLLVAILIRCSLGFPILFRQVRSGLFGKPFVLVKFRTMTQACDAAGLLLDDSARLTPLGSMLRKLSVDELPQLWNVVKGDMSLVGPRPLLMEYLPLYSPRQARRHEVRPGLTGWAQVNGRNSLSWAERLEMDVWYVENRSAGLELKIIWLTLCRVFERDGINQPGSATMDRFRGNDVVARQGK